MNDEFYLIEDFDHLELTIKDNEIVNCIDCLTGAELKTFHYRLAQNKTPKIYILKENDAFLYVGTTMQSLSNRLKSGLKANGKLGYHGYKWKGMEKVDIYVWRFEQLDKKQLESIEAELVFSIRDATGMWPLSQNEIHFNNEFQPGRLIARRIFKYLNTNMKKSPFNINVLFFEKPDQFGLRGDDYLWDELRQMIENEYVPNTIEFKDFLYDCFYRLTGERISKGRDIYVERYNHGGMSGGYVNSDFWLGSGFPKLLNRYELLLKDNGSTIS